MSTSNLVSNIPKYLQESDLTQECKDLISSLPTERGWIGHVHQYQGFWYTDRLLQATITCQRHFQAHDTDILLVTTPKSGTTWLKAMVFALMNRVQYPYNNKNHPLLSKSPQDLVPSLEHGLYFDGQAPDLTTFASPRILGTHLPLVSLPDSVKTSPCKLVFLCRNPKDNFVSFWHFINKMTEGTILGTISLEESFDKFSRGVNIFGPFWDHVLGYWKESLGNPKRVLFLKYEEMKEQPKVELMKLARFLGRPFSSEEETNGTVEGILKLCSFENLSNLEVNKTGKLVTGQDYNMFYRRGEVGDAENYLTPRMIEKLDQITEEKLHVYGLKF